MLFLFHSFKFQGFVENFPHDVKALQDRAQSEFYATHGRKMAARSKFTIVIDLHSNGEPRNSRCAESHKSADDTARKAKPIRWLSSPGRVPNGAIHAEPNAHHDNHDGRRKNRSFDPVVAHFSIVTPVSGFVEGVA
jgi:hypothetical protein